MVASVLRYLNCSENDPSLSVTAHFMGKFRVKTLDPVTARVLGQFSITKAVLTYPFQSEKVALVYFPDTLNLKDFIKNLG